MRLSLCLAAAVLWVSLPTALCRAWQLDSREANAVKAGGTAYFTTKMENLTTKLDLTPDQQAKLKPIAEQEVGFLEEIRGNSGLSRKEKLARLQQIVLDSDKQMKPWLSVEQWDKLQALRKEQKEQLKQYAKTK
jgi:hypothetical protein